MFLMCNYCPEILQISFSSKENKSKQYTPNITSTSLPQRRIIHFIQRLFPRIVILD